MIYITPEQYKEKHGVTPEEHIGSLLADADVLMAEATDIANTYDLADYMLAMYQEIATSR